MMYFASVARTSSVCLSDSLAPLVLMDCQAASNAASRMPTASGSKITSSWRKSRTLPLQVASVRLPFNARFDNTRVPREHRRSLRRLDLDHRGAALDGDLVFSACSRQYPDRHQLRSCLFLRSPRSSPP